MIKDNIDVINRKGINYLLENKKKIIFKPWLGDVFSIFYDSIMKKTIFPKKFEASIEKHNEFLLHEYTKVRNCTVLEIATGSGNISKLLPYDNKYTGVDISKGLLKIAYKNFSDSGINDFNLFLCSADSLPFKDNYFDICICNLSLNFFPDVPRVILEIKRVLTVKGVFICSVPVPERNRKKSVIRGKVYSENELKLIFEEHGFTFVPSEFTNGTLLYFQAILE